MPKVSKQNRCPAGSPSIYEGAGSRIRTDDLLITNQLLYQLSYAGICLDKRSSGCYPDVERLYTTISTLLKQISRMAAGTHSASLRQAHAAAGDGLRKDDGIATGQKKKEVHL